MFLKWLRIQVYGQGLILSNARIYLSNNLQTALYVNINCLIVGTLNYHFIKDNTKSIILSSLRVYIKISSDVHLTKENQNETNKSCFPEGRYCFQILIIYNNTEKKLSKKIFINLTCTHFYFYFKCVIFQNAL